MRYNCNMNKDGKICGHNSCNREVTGHGAFGYCPKHYRRYKKYGDTSIVGQGGPQKIIGNCSVNGCKSDLLQKGFCRAHYMKWYRHGDPLFKMPLARGRTPTVQSWQAMKRRCVDPKNASYARYGGRGITYAPKWDKYEGFVEDMGERPKDTTIDRINSDGNYTKDNCRWATLEVQANNMSGNHLITYGDETMTLTQWGRRVGLLPKTLAERIRVGWSVEKALTTPSQKST